MNQIRWGIIGCGDVTEVKSGPGFQKAEGSALLAVMRRDRAKAEDYARRHNVPRVHATAEALILDPEIDAVYIATPPSTHCQLALMAAAAGKPCLVEKPMAMDHAECVRMADAFRRAGQPLWVAFYRRALPRFLKVRELLRDGVIGQVTSVHQQITEPRVTPERVKNWRFDRAIAGAGLFFDLGSHCFDIVEFLVGEISAAAGFSINTAQAYEAEDVTSAAFQIGDAVAGTGIWNFNATSVIDRLVLTGSKGELSTPILFDQDVIVTVGGERTVFPIRNPPHVHQPLIQTIVDELRGRGRCESTGESGARSAWVMDQCLGNYYKRN